MNFIGINIGSISIKTVEFTDIETITSIQNHHGKPFEKIQELKEKYSSNSYFAVSGHLGHISEAEAIQRALDSLDGEFDKNRILTVLTHNRCAAGSGEFLIQQIDRFNLTLEEAIERAKLGNSIQLASRCSVYCKTDVTHKLNKAEASVEDILWSIHESMANKVVSLIEKRNSKTKSALVIGGLSLNPVMINCLEDKLPEMDFHVIDQSPYFEAYGTALLSRDSPEYTFPKVSITPGFSQMPSLKEYGDLVTIIPSDEYPELSRGEQLILGIDGGSTTTKAVLLETKSNRIVASFYARTNGNPIQATKLCISKIHEQIGNQQVDFVATTGSAREIIGAFVGTSAVYNEISAHAAGSAFYDREVDTVFEIGGQDAKYIYLQNGVPIDYAMNAACSAGTGSFLEESAKGDLGIEVTDIGEIALRAPSPVQFKAECAAFINSDIRAALQEGFSQDNIVGGLVYSIVRNYLNKVKGYRPVGKKVFLQGGVAKNHAMVYAFAQATQKQIIVPPHPELMGAFGVAMMAKEQYSLNGSVSLSTLSKATMTKLGSFTCRGCENYCQIDRFEIAGRKFPFGGQCSKYENQWKRNKSIPIVEDFVAQRNDLIFSAVKSEPFEGAKIIGIPRALSTHILLPLYYTFFQQLNFNVIVSEIEKGSDLRTNASFCFPAQLAHGAVMDLIEQGVDYIFLPQLSTMPDKKSERKDRMSRSFLCPVTQASPYIIKKAFDKSNILSPLLAFHEGYSKCTGLIDVATTLGVSKSHAAKAYKIACEVQLEIESKMRNLGTRALRAAVESKKPSVLLVGRSYNAFPSEASHSMGRKLASKGIITVPIDCVDQTTSTDTAWYFSNLILDAVDLVKKYSNLYVLYIRNFSCNIDSFTQESLRKQLGSKPFLSLEIDSHTADAGTQTRLEAFIEIIQNYQTHGGLNIDVKSFQMAKIEVDDAGVWVRTSSGQKLSIKDPAINMYFPSFSYFHDGVFPLPFKWIGIQTAPPLHVNKQQLDLGLQFTSGKECLPLPITIGQLLQAYRNKKPGEIVGMYVISNGAPCVIDAYVEYFEEFIEEHQLDDVFIFAPNVNNNYYGLTSLDLFTSTPYACTVADMFNEMEGVLHVVGGPGALDELHAIWKDLMKATVTYSSFKEAVNAAIPKIAAISVIKDVATCPKVIITGDFFVRFDPFFIQGIRKRYAKAGIILKAVDLNELLQYSPYDDMDLSARNWGTTPYSKKAAVHAISKCFSFDAKRYFFGRIALKTFSHYEKKVRNIFEPTGLLISNPTNIDKVVTLADSHIHRSIFGEGVLTVGKGLEAYKEKYDGIMVLGPFSCLPFKISEAILKPYFISRNYPIISFETDGNVVFLRIVDIHIQQILMQSSIENHENEELIPLDVIE
jgi:predicted CoA-substrate-specific enzyme activase